MLTGFVVVGRRRRELANI